MNLKLLLLGDVAVAQLIERAQPAETNSSVASDAKSR
jgi:hypothetical protein